MSAHAETNRLRILERRRARYERIAELARRGVRNIEIARKLDCSPRTVRRAIVALGGQGRQGEAA